jgi:nitroreductase
MTGPAPTEHPVHDLLTRRYSPYVFAAERDVSDADVHGLLEAARWTMSSYNEQPWRYLVGSRSRSPAVWQAVLDILVPGNQVWAREAPVLMLGLISTRFARNGEENKAAAHDLGAASACLTVEATARGLCVHQMIGIDAAAAAARLQLPDSMNALTALAIGYAGDPAACTAEYAARDTRPRERKPLSDILWQLPETT